MIRILHVLGGLDRGGAESLIMSWYRKIDRDKIQFDFIIHDKSKIAYVNEIESMGGKVYLFPKFNGNNFYSYKQYWHTFLSNHSEYKILHSHIRSFASLFLPIAKKYELITIVHSHSTSNGSGLKGFSKNILQIPLRRQADYLFACSDKAGQWLYGKNVKNRKNYYLVKNGVDIERFKFKESTRKSYRKMLSVDDSLVIGHVGRFTDPKNHSFIIDIFTKILKKEKTAKLILVGNGELEDNIRDKVNNCGITDKVIFLKNRSDVDNIMQAFDVFLFPSKWEGLPVSVIEAQASGLPCLLSDTITKEVQLSNLIHYLSLNRGADEWADNCIHLTRLRNNDEKNKLKENGYDIKETAQWLTEFYQNILQ